MTGKRRRKRRRILRWALSAILVLTAVFSFLMILNCRTPSATDLSSSQQLAVPPPPLREPIELTIATFNVFCPPYISTHRRERLRAIGETLCEAKPDVVGFQEAFDSTSREVLVRTLRSCGLSYNRYFKSGLEGSGLLIASRYPFAEVHFLRYSAWGKFYKVHHGDWWAGKGIALVRLRHPQGFIDFFNTHSHASYDGNDYHDTRLAQMRELAKYIATAEVAFSPTFVVGDFNCSRDEPQYSTLVDGAGLEDLLDYPADLDYLFAVSTTMYKITVLSARSISANIEVENERIPVSDHLGRLATVRVEPNL